MKSKILLEKNINELKELRMTPYTGLKIAGFADKYLQLILS